MNSSNIISQDDYPNIVTDALYQHEKSLIALKGAAKLLQGSQDANDEDSDMDESDYQKSKEQPAEPPNAAARAILSSRAGFIGALQCWELDNQGAAPRVQGLCELIEESTLKNDTEGMRQYYSCLGSTIDEHVASSATSKKLLARSESCKADVDEFFETFPELVQSPRCDSYTDEDESSSSDEEDENEVVDVTEYHKQKQSRVTKDSSVSDVGLKNPYNQKSGKNQPMSQQHESSAAAYAVPAQPGSSYSQSSENFSYTPSTPSEQQVPTQQQPPPSQQPGLFQRQYPPPSQPPAQQQWQNSTLVRNPYSNPARPAPPARSMGPPPDSSSWDDQLQQQNPFQSAAEFARMGKHHGNNNKDDYGRDQQKQQQRQQQQQRRRPPTQAAENPYSRTRHQNNDHDEDEDNNEPFVPVKPSVPESLRRPYRNPCQQKQKKAAADSTGGKRTLGGKPAVHHIRKGKASTTSSNGGGGTAKKKNNNNNGKNDTSDDDDELPEELQHLDKELVRKIEFEIMYGGDPVKFDDIAGLKDAKATIDELVCQPMLYPKIFTGLRRAPKALLLFGPPGTGKTLIGKAIAHQSGATFFSMSSSSLTSKWIGEGEKLVKTMFAVAAYRGPSVVFIDEIDSLLTQRTEGENESSRRIKNEFLTQMDGLGGSKSDDAKVLTIGTTNRPQELDDAARRRFIKRVYIPLPEAPDRCTLLKILLRDNTHNLTASDLEKLSHQTEGFSGADLASLCNDAAMGPIRAVKSLASVDPDNMPPILYKHFKNSLRGMKPSNAPADLLQYEEWNKVYGSRRVAPDEETENDSHGEETADEMKDD